MTPSRLFSAAAFAAASLLATAPSAQVVIDDFENGIGPGEFVFAGAEPGVLSLTTDTPEGSGSAVQFDVDADEYGGFTGFGQPVEGGALDVTGVMNPVVTFDVAATGTFTLEVNFQNTGGGGEGEIRNALRFNGGTDGYQTFRLTLPSFFTTNAQTFEYDDVFQYVFTVLDAVGDGDTGTAETSVQIDNVQVVEGLSFETNLSAFDFDSGDFSEFFFFAGGEGIMAAPTTDTPDGSANAFNGMLDGDEFGGFAGFGATIAGAPIDVTGTESLNFFLRTNGPATLEVNIQTDAASGGNEVRERIALSDTEGAYRMYSIPLEAFIQSSANAANLASVYNLVFTLVDIPGDSDPGTSEFSFDLDGVGFGVQAPPVAAEALPEVLDAAPTVYPNPTAGAATVSFELTEPTALQVAVFDVLGRRVATLAEGPQAAGPVQLAVRSGTLVPGTYLVRVQTEVGATTTRLTVAR